MNGKYQRQHQDKSALYGIEPGGPGYVSPVLRLVQHLGDGAREAAERQQAVRAVRPLKGKKKIHFFYADNEKKKGVVARERKQSSTQRKGRRRKAVAAGGRGQGGEERGGA